MLDTMFEIVKRGITYKVYQKEDPDKPKVVLPHPQLKIGDWIEDGTGLIVQVLDVKWFRGAIVSMYVRTVYGLDILLRYNKSGYWSIYKVDFRRPRINENSFTAKAKDKLTQKDKWLLKALFITGDMYRAYQVVYGELPKNESQKYNLKQKFRRLFSMSESDEFYRDRVLEILKEKGVAKPEWFVAKLLESVDGKIDSLVKLNIVKMLAGAVNESDINRLMGIESRDGDNQGLIPIAPSRPTMELTDGSSTSDRTDGEAEG